MLESKCNPCFLEKAENVPERHAAMLSFKKGGINEDGTLRKSQMKDLS